LASYIEQNLDAMNVLKPLELPEDPDDIDADQENEEDDAQSDDKEEIKSGQAQGDAGEQ